MYAKCWPNDVYHLITSDREHTLCGLGVLPIIIDGPVEILDLHLTSQPPTESKLCEACIKAKTDMLHSERREGQLQDDK